MIKLDEDAMVASKISSKGQITLPLAVRKALNAKPGDRVLFMVENGKVVLRPLGPCSAADLAARTGGCLVAYALPGAAEGSALTGPEVAQAGASEGMNWPCAAEAFRRFDCQPALPDRRGSSHGRAFRRADETRRVGRGA